MFARRHNHLNSHLQAHLQLLSEDQLLERYQRMHDLIYPAIHEGSNQEGLSTQHFTDKTRQLKQSIPVGTHVMTLNMSKRYKNEPTWEGPFKVVRITRAKTHVLQDRALELLPRNYTRHELKIIQSADPTDQSQVIKRIVNHRGTSTNREYLVEWENKALPDSWIPAFNFDDPAALTLYWRKRNSSSRRQSPTPPPVSNDSSSTPIRQSSRLQGGDVNY